MFLLCKTEKTLHAGLIGLIFGVTIIGTGYAWLASFIQWTGLWALCFLGATLLYQSIFFFAFAFFFHRLAVKNGPAVALLSAPLIWTVLEYLASFGILGIPEPIGHSQFLNPILRQGAPILGVNFLTFLAVSFSSILVLAVLDVRKNPKGVAALAFYLMSLIVGTCLINAHQRKAQEKTKDQTVSVLLVQPSISADLLNDSRKGEEVLNAYLVETRKLLAPADRPIDLIIWPEMVFPYTINEDSELRRSLIGSLGEMKGDAELLIGGPSKAGDGSYYNSAFLFSAAGPKDAYEKERLFPFGEYIPYHEYLNFIKEHLPEKLRIADYIPGRKIGPIASKSGRIGATICLESLFTDLARKRVRDGAEFLVNLTNDAWFSGSSAEERHFFIGAMRALENGRYFIQSTSSGVTGVVDPEGRILERTGPIGNHSLWTKIERIREKTMFTRMGLWRFPIFALFSILSLFLYRRFSSGRRTGGARRSASN